MLFRSQVKLSSWVRLNLIFQSDPDYHIHRAYLPQNTARIVESEKVLWIMCQSRGVRVEAVKCNDSQTDKTKNVNRQ